VTTAHSADVRVLPDPPASRANRGYMIIAAIASLVVAVSGSAALAGVLPPGGTFTDDNGNIHEGSIEAIAADGVTKGCNPPTNDLYCPGSSVTRGQMAAFLTRALGLPATSTDFFTDDNDSVFESDINRMAAAGVTNGCNPPDNDRFCPGNKVTREVMAAFLVRAYGYTDDGRGDLFTDDDESIFEGDIDRLGTAGVTKGCSPPDNTLYCPKSLVLRDQMASFLTRALGLTPTVPLLPIVGLWEGTAMTPTAWSEIGQVTFEFRADGSYTSTSAGDVPALYWGTRDNSPLQTYEFWGPSPGGGEIAVVFIGSGIERWARVENVWTEGDQLRFEIWNDWGKSPPYGPVTYDLARVG
jgi:hypothetical protein